MSQTIIRLTDWLTNILPGFSIEYPRYRVTRSQLSAVEPASFGVTFPCPLVIPGNGDCEQPLIK